MSRYLATAFALLASSVSFAFADEIPLKEIWALNMPGTRPVSQLDPPRKGEPHSEEEFIKTSLVEQIAQLLNASHWPEEGEKAGPAFVIVGTGLDSLRQAHTMLAGKEERAESVPADKEITLVFYAYYGRTVRLDGVERRGSDLVVKYHLHAHKLAMSTPHFALIPLGKLSPGKMNVRIQRLPDTGPSEIVQRLNARPAERFVCGSFDFEVTDR